MTKYVGRGLDVTEAIKEFTDKKTERVFKHYPKKDADLIVTYSVQKDTHKVEMLLLVKGVFFKATASTNDLYASIEEATDKLEAKLSKYKDKSLTKRLSVRKGDETFKMAVYEPFGMDGDDNDENIGMSTAVVVKDVPFKPMMLDEAVLQMELLHKNFYVFRDVEDNSVKVVYVRDDKKIGLFYTD